MDRVFVAPGNAGTAVDAENVPIAPGDFPALAQVCPRESRRTDGGRPRAAVGRRIGGPISKGGPEVFGPSPIGRTARRFARSSARTCCDVADVPTADFQVFREPDAAVRFLNERYPDPNQPVPLVVKADGLAAGKGVIVCQDA